jgi:hypothetical protein
VLVLVLGFRVAAVLNAETIAEMATQNAAMTAEMVMLFPLQHRDALACLACFYRCHYLYHH